MRAHPPATAALILFFAGCTIPGEEPTREASAVPPIIAESVASVVEPLRESYFAELQEQNVVGSSVAVVSADQTLWSEGYGFADDERTVAADAETRFLIGSVTKVFTAFAVMQLVDSGLVDLDEAVSSYLPEFQLQSRFADAPAITVRHLLTHHSGLPDDVWAGKFAQNPEDYRSLTGLTADLHACYPPGKIRVYSNLGYSILGHLVEVVSGMPYTEYIRSRIFAPVGMGSTGFFTEADQAGQFAAAYNEKGRLQEELPLRDLPAGAVFSTASDMGLFVQAILRLDPALVSPAARKEMFRVQNDRVPLDLDDRVGICFSLSNRALSAGRVFEHGGATLYHRSHMYVAPDSGLGAVVLSNSSRGVESAWRLNEELIVALASHRGFAGNRMQNRLRSIDFDVRVGTDLRHLAGLYAMPGVVFDVRWKREMLFTSIAGNRFYLLPDSRDAFVPAKRFLFWTFPYRKRWFLFQHIAGHDLFLEATPWGDLVIMGERVHPEPILPPWEEATGVWLPTLREGELPMIEELRLSEEDGLLTAGFSLMGRREVSLGLETISDSQAVALGLGRMGGEVFELRGGGGTSGPQELHFKGMVFRRG